MNIIFGRSFDIVNTSKSYFDAVFEIPFRIRFCLYGTKSTFFKLVSV